MSSRLALPVSGPAHKDRDAYTVAAGTVFVCAACTFHAYLAKWGKEESTEGEHTELKPYERVQIKSKAEGNAHKNWDTVYVGEKGFYCD
ncbi:hypothetical protein G5I_08046 [Acromyrmex echinatior]|uniref:Uncharacterized protein n=1 Tax=Acromyrmex echinatior TaxID=103372 RepID=F4WQK1_ACREC|nr:hypothetical protein G5I_08046 [Acromyrmex echinatior]